MTLAKIKTNFPHVHAGKWYPKGTILEVTEADAQVFLSTELENLDGKLAPTAERYTGTEPAVNEGELEQAS